jgi:hypothetical protein
MSINVQHTEKILKRSIDFLLRPIVIFIICLILIVNIYLGGGGIISNITVIFLGFYIIFVFLEYVLNVNITTNISNLFSLDPNISIKIEKQDKQDKQKKIKIVNKLNKEVFNIPGNNYSYDEAKLMCKAVKADLATYDQIESAYNSGAEWCNYGWSEGQMALFPIQKKTYNKLQNVEGHENDCGRPGINGGYFEDAEIKFGVNCYGIKPEINTPSEELMNNMTFFPQSEKDLEMKEKLDFLKTKINDVIISPFNVKNWRQI